MQQRAAHRHAGPLAATFAALLAVVPPALADRQLAVDKGCWNCHGEPSKKKAPTFAALAADYAPYRGQPEAVQRLAAQLRAGSPFSHIDAHERLSAADAERPVRWIVDGAP